MKSYNNVTLIGRAVRDPDFKDTGSANARVQFALAVDRPYKDAEGKRPTDFLNVVAWSKLAEICHDYIQKGCLVLVSGRIQSRSYETGAETKWITEIIADSVNILEYRQAKVAAEDKKEVKTRKKAA